MTTTVPIVWFLKILSSRALYKILKILSLKKSSTVTIDDPISLRQSIQIDDLISDENMQEGLVPYKINSDSESDCENYPKKAIKEAKGDARVKKLKKDL